MEWELHDDEWELHEEFEWELHDEELEFELHDDLHCDCDLQDEFELDELCELNADDLLNAVLLKLLLL